MEGLEVAAGAGPRCGLCGETDAAERLRAPSPDAPAGPVFMLYACRRCGFAFVYPIPDAGTLSRLYAVSGYYGERKAAAVAGSSLNRAFLTLKARKVERLRPGRGRVLDFGCGSGELLECLGRRGWDVYGVEPSGGGSAGHSPSLAGRVESSIEPLKARGLRFDVITLWHVLEHLPDPAAALESLRPLLKEDGLLFAAVPNFASLEARAGAEWFHLDLPRHLCHFTPFTLDATLRKAGFEPAAVSYQSLGYNAFGMLQTWLNVLGPERNHFYNALKRGAPAHVPSFLGRLRQAGVSWLGGPVLAPVSVVASVLAGLAKRSGTMEITARRGRA